MLTRANPERASRLMALAQADADERWHYYSQMAGVERVIVMESEHADIDTDGEEQS